VLRRTTNLDAVAARTAVNEGVMSAAGRVAVHGIHVDGERKIGKWVCPAVDLPIEQEHDHEKRRGL